MKQQMKVTPKWISISQIWMDMKDFPPDDVKHLHELFAQVPDTKVLETSKEISSFQKIMMDIVEEVLSLKIMSLEQYLWLTEFSIKFFLIKRNSHHTDFFVQQKILQKLRSYKNDPFSCLNVLQSTAVKFHHIIGDNAFNLAHVLTKMSSISSGTHFVFASLSSVAIKTYFQIECDGFLPWQPQNIVPFLQTLKFDLFKQPKEAAEFLKTLGNFLCLCLNHRYIPTFAGNKNFEKYFLVDEIKRKACSNEILKFATNIQQQISSEIARNKDNTDLQLVHTILECNVLCGLKMGRKPVLKENTLEDISFFKM